MLGRITVIVSVDQLQAYVRLCTAPKRRCHSGGFLLLPRLHPLPKQAGV